MSTGMFDAATLRCPICDKDWEGIELWNDGHPHLCGPCSRQAHADRMAAINSGRPYTVSSIGGACPTQAEGRAADDRPWYFRARHGDWTLSIGKPGDQDMPYGYDAELLAEGDDPSNGWMEDDEVLAITDHHLGGAA